jgi:hypothetical protein
MSIIVTPIPRVIDLAVPAFTLGTANAAGTAETAVASDSTLLAFDATVPDAITFGQSGAAGSATVTSRRDHAHAMAALADIPLTALDINGGTDIGEALIDTDLLIVDNGAGGTNRKSEMSRIATYVGSAISRVDGDTTEATTTSTSTVDLLATTGSFSVGALQQMFVVFSARKTSGAADNTGCGIKLNSSQLGAGTGNNAGWLSTTNNRAEDGNGAVWLPARLTNYLRGGSGTAGQNASSGGSPNAQVLVGVTNSGAAPTAAITAVVVNGVTDNASNTLGADEMHVYALAVS